MTLNLKPGMEISASSHKRPVLVDFVSRKGLCVGRSIKKNGKPGEIEVIVQPEKVTAVRLVLPGVADDE